MRIVIDTNVVASAVFFGGHPEELLRKVLMREVFAVATEEIVEEYQRTLDYLAEKYKGKEVAISAVPIISAMELIASPTRVEICRDPDDNKFISCALDGGCYYIISGDKDLLTIQEYSGVKIVTVTDFLAILRNEG